MNKTERENFLWLLGLVLVIAAVLAIVVVFA